MNDITLVLTVTATTGTVKPMLSLDNARKLYNQLDELFGDRKPQELPVYPPGCRDQRIMDSKSAELTDKHKGLNK